MLFTLYYTINQVPYNKDADQTVFDPEDRFSHDWAHIRAVTSTNVVLVLTGTGLFCLTETSLSVEIWVWKFKILYYLGSKNSGTDQTVQMLRLICTFAFLYRLKATFQLPGSTEVHVINLL